MNPQSWLYSEAQIWKALKKANVSGSHAYDIEMSSDYFFVELRKIKEQDKKTARTRRIRLRRAKK